MSNANIKDAASRDEQALEDARLIAAAPVLLQTLREFVAAYNDAMPVKYAEDADYMLARMSDIKDLATRAINEATGAVEGVGEDE